MLLLLLLLLGVCLKNCLRLSGPSRTVPYHSQSFSMVPTFDIASFVVVVFQIYKRTYGYLRWRGRFIY